MPFTHVDDQPSAEEAFFARHRSSAMHPSARKLPQVVNIFAPYQALPVPAGAVFPRATVRPRHFIDGSGHGWAVKIWVAPGVPARKGSQWVIENFRNLPDAMDWAATEVEDRRPKDQGSGPWGAAC